MAVCERERKRDSVRTTAFDLDAVLAGTALLEATRGSKADTLAQLLLGIANVRQSAP